MFPSHSICALLTEKTVYWIIPGYFRSSCIGSVREVTEGEFAAMRKQIHMPKIFYYSKWKYGIPGPLHRWDLVQATSDPRCLKTHLPFSLLQPRLLDRAYKVGHLQLY